jgi:uncharacterized protein (PEP-CTERM system associated)
VRPTLRATRNLSASVRLGYESNDYFVPAYSDAVYGAGFAWTPNPRTKLDGFLDHRFFGASYEVNLSYRTRRTVWRVRGSRNTITPLDQPLSQRPITTAELLDQAFRARIADPTERERVVRQFLDSAGLPASLTQPYSFYAPTIYVSEQWSGSVGLLGRRNTADLTLFWQDNTPLASVGLTPASAFAYDPFRQLGVALNFTHRISRLTSVTLGASRFQTKRTGTAALAQDTLTQDTGRVGLTHQLGPKTEFTVALRWLRFDSVTDPYRERAVLVALAHSF